MQAKTTTTAGATIVSQRKAATLLQVGMAALLGVFLVWGAGFSPIAAVHNAAHDARHSNGFPCH
ncbi:CbtB domain-containing protein [uncultured Ferrovibrio sp.]|jgi:cobalt transporter subunit CbtB|uniref:CbtB domain-containing protein n=1 Tax=uncultured Ferrovibrio sp. TaxID=1576913 RepID=UPI00260AEAC8|nr:CbtB domain-containing protein [uncultured Ferrovibrio sp.]